MNKWIKIALSLILLLSGCQTKNTLSYEKLNNELPYLCEEGFDINYVLSSVEFEKQNLFENLIDVYDYEYDTLGISSENVSHGIVRVSTTSAQMYMVFTPVKGKEKELVGELNSLLSNKKLLATNEDDKELLEQATIEENDDFIALIVSINNQEVLSRIKNSKKYYFGVLTPATDDDLPNYGLSKSMVSSYSIQKPLLTCSKTFMVIKPKVGQMENVREAIDSYLIKLRNQFIMIPNEEVLVSNALVTEYEGYLIVVISENNEKVFDTIKTYFEK